MIAVSLEYVEGKADKIYIYASTMDGIYLVDYFFEINHVLYYKHQLSEEYDTSDERQDKCLDILMDDLIEIIDLCDEYNRDIPKEIKIIYEVKENKVNAIYSYEEIPLDNDDLNIREKIWFNSIKENL